MLWLTLRKLKSKDHEVRLEAIRKLGESTNNRAMKPLIETLIQDYGFTDNYSDQIRSATVTALNLIAPNWLASELGRDAMQRLFAQLKSPEAPTRASALDALVCINDKSAIPSLIPMLEDDDFYVRQRASEALAKFGDIQAIPALIMASVKDQGLYWVKLRQISEQWGKFEEAKSVVPELLSVFDNWEGWVAQFRKDREAFRARNPRVLGSLADDMAKVWKIRQAAAFALGEIGDAQAVEPLIQALNDEEIPVRATAAEALGKIGDPRAADSLLDALMKGHYDSRSGSSSSTSQHDPDYKVSVKSAIAKALGQLREKRAVEPLIEVLESYPIDRLYFWSAIEALGQIGDKRAVEPLAKLLSNTGWGGAEYAARSLGEIGGAEAQAVLEDAIGRMKDNPALKKLEATLRKALARAVRLEAS